MTKNWDEPQPRMNANERESIKPYWRPASLRGSPDYFQLKTLFAAALLGLAAVSGWAQGTVDFRNNGPTFATPADRLVYVGQVGGTKLTGTNYVAGLWFAPGAGNTAIDKTGGTQAGTAFNFRQPTTSSPGTWNPGAERFIFTLDGIALDSDVTLQVRVWDSVRYSSFQAALAAGNYAVSAPFHYHVPALGSPPDGYYMEGLRGFGGAGPVPEPTAIVLAVLGVACLLFLRRR